jgi:hypothetical protein
MNDQLFGLALGFMIGVSACSVFALWIVLVI